jgi:shikimate dehydrogenase
MGRFGLVGGKLGHSFSGEIHRLIGEFSGEKYDYTLYEIEPEKVEDFMKNTDLDGFNVTIPYKETVIPFCTKLSEKAAFTCSVNTVLVRRNGDFQGENTDFLGFSRLLEGYTGIFREKKGLILGSGGSSRTVQAVLSDKKIPYVVISRSGEDNYQNLHKHRDAALIVNTTPVGMYPNNGESPVDLSLFPNCRLVIDLIYNPARTALLLQAEELGIPARNGLLMLAEQGVRAAELFLGKSLPDGLADRIAGEISRRTLNIVLVGMPGCGKTTVGRHLSALTGRAFADTDELICAKFGKNPAEIIASEGEAAFRGKESGVLREISKESGMVISTGGGVVTLPENRALIRQNGVCIYLEKDISKLALSGRPLSLAKGVEALFGEREPLYRLWSDCTYANEDSLATAKKIKEDLGL